MPSARKAGVPPDVIKGWEEDFRQKKADQKQKGLKRLPSGSVQYVHEGVTYTAKWSGPNKSVSFPQAAYEAQVEGGRSRRGEQQKIQLSSIEQKLVDQKYEYANFLSNLMGQKIVVDHIIPIGKKGFSNDPNNLQLLTDKTNSKKRDSTEWYNAALEESKYLSDLAFKESSGVNFNGSAAKLNVNAIMTRANMPALGGFQQQEITPTTLPGGSSYTPPKLQPSQPVQLPETPVTPKVQMAPTVMESIAEGIETATPYVVGAGTAVGGLMLNMAQGAASLLFNAPGP